jgi:CubicO group peptidase (beta-lactamase class C family)
MALHLRRSFLPLLFSFVWMAAASNRTAAQSNTYATPYFADKDRVKQLTTYFPLVEKMYREYAEKHHMAGYAFGIVADGKLVFSGSGGWADINKKVPATTRSIFRIASMSKSFTAMAILQLRDQGKLQLDDPVSKYVSELKGQQLTTDAPEITIRHLMTHSAGFPEDNPWGDRQLADTDQQLLELLRQKISFSNVPGIAYEYSNLGFALLGYIIQKVSGIPYSSSIEKNIWQPLGMAQSSWEYKKVPAPLLAHGYRWVNEGWKEEALLSDGVWGAMGGMLTSIESFSKYVAFHLQAWPVRNNPEVGPLKRSSLREMHQPWRLASVNANYRYPSGRAVPLTAAYGYGLRYAEDGEGRKTVGHSGGLLGFGSNWVMLPEYGIGLIFFANVTYAPTSLANVAVMDTLLRLTGLQPMRLPPSTILTQRRDMLVRLLPEWDGAANTGFFAENFFDDYYVSKLRDEARAIYAAAGRILQVGEVVPENQLRGYFIQNAEKGNIRIRFTLTPETPARIQEYHISLEKN